MAVPMGWRQGVAKRAANQRCLQERQQKNRAEVRKAEPRTRPRSGSPAWIGEAESPQHSSGKAANTEVPENTGVLNVFKLLETSEMPSLALTLRCYITHC